MGVENNLLEYLQTLFRGLIVVACQIRGCPLFLKNCNFVKTLLISNYCFFNTFVIDLLVTPDKITCALTGSSIQQVL